MCLKIWICNTHNKNLKVYIGLAKKFVWVFCNFWPTQYFIIQILEYSKIQWILLVVPKFPILKTRHPRWYLVILMYTQSLRTAKTWETIDWTDSPNAIKQKLGKELKEVWLFYPKVYYCQGRRNWEKTNCFALLYDSRFQKLKWNVSFISKHKSLEKKSLERLEFLLQFNPVCNYLTSLWWTGCSI